MGMPFYFSSINHSMLSQNPMDSMNLFWNQQLEANKANMLAYMTPAYDFNSVWRFPEFSTFGNQLLNPMLAIQQTMQNWQNNNWGNFGNFGNWNFTPWQNPNNEDTSKKTDEKKLEEKKMQREYDDLKALINVYKNIEEAKIKNGLISIKPDLLLEIKNALSKSGKIEEKLESLKNVYNKIDKNSLKKALTSLSTKDFNLKERLEKAGYNFGNKDYSAKNAKDADLNSMLDRIHSEIEALSSKNPNSLKEFKGLIEPMVTEGNNDILRVISYWNDKYGLTKDGKKNDDEGCIIRFMMKKMNEVDANAKADIQSSVNKLVDALTAKANYIKDNSEGFDEGTVNALGGQITNVTKAKEAAAGKATSDSLSNLANEFEKLYVLLRRMEALQINQAINNKYSFLNNISNTDTDIIDKDIIVKDTEADLKKEGLDGVDTTKVQLVDYKAEPKTAQEDIEDLRKDGTLTYAKAAEDKTKDLEGYYQDHKGTFYTIRDGKIIRLDGVTLIYSNDRCAHNGKMCSVSEVKGTEVTKNDIPKKDNSGSGNTPAAGEDLISTMSEAAKRYYYSAKERLEDKAASPNSLGREFADAICQGTDADEFAKMQGYIRIIDKNNVVDFIKGYYYRDYVFANGFFEQIASEGESSRLTNGEVAHVLKALFDHINEKYPNPTGQDEKDFATIKAAYYECKAKDPTKKFSNPQFWKRIIGTDDLDNLDDAIERIWIDTKKAE